MYSERGLDEWTRNEISHPGVLDDDDENEDRTIADILEDLENDKRRAANISGAPRTLIKVNKF